MLQPCSTYTQCTCLFLLGTIFASTHAIKISLSNLMAYHNICLCFERACVWILCSSVKSKSLFNMHDHKRFFMRFCTFFSGIKMSISIHVPNIFIYDFELLIQMSMLFFSGENKVQIKELSKEHFSQHAPCVNIL